MKEPEEISPGELGFDSFFEPYTREPGSGGFTPARVTAEYKEAYKVRTTKGEYPA